ncbi:hypothetical protein KNJ79_13165 [Sphingopyxis indica]|uniref:hypothetical protein n=1 Tax=Sphingopyxis indica TaxID=436663 RepID=UPI0029394D76|nr:hypothetical protein [Sphingopyxis indica]WOF42160.1 hypothetical protein KNJ79_13165 [Sphingopyxis indica]
MITKQHFRTDTLAFRLGSSLAVLWLLWTGYQGFTQYKADKQSAAEFWTQSRMESCSRDVLADNTNIYAGWRKPTYDEQLDCQASMRAFEAQLEARKSWLGRHDDERRALAKFANRGLIPVGVVLFVVGMWGLVSAAVLEALGWIIATIMIYINWLRTGKFSPGDD